MDLVAPAGHDLGAAVLRADLTDFGQAVEVLTGCDAVIHLANIPAPGLRTAAVTFNANMTMNFNVFMAATQAGIGRVVWASSQTTLGLPFDVPPRTHQWMKTTIRCRPPPTRCRKWRARRSPATSRNGPASRSSHCDSPHLGPADYQQFPAYWKDPQLRKWNLWGYIDERMLLRRACFPLDADLSGSASFIIAAADTVMTRPCRLTHPPGLPRCGAHQGGHGERHVAVHRPGPAGDRIHPGAQVAHDVTADQAS